MNVRDPLLSNINVHKAIRQAIDVRASSRRPTTASRRAPTRTIPRPWDWARRGAGLRSRRRQAKSYMQAAGVSKANVSALVDAAADRTAARVIQQKTSPRHRPDHEHQHSGAASFWEIPGRRWRPRQAPARLQLLRDQPSPYWSMRRGSPRGSNLWTGSSSSTSSSISFRQRASTSTSPAPQITSRSQQIFNAATPTWSGSPSSPTLRLQGVARRRVPARRRPDVLEIHRRLTRAALHASRVAERDGARLHVPASHHDVFVIVLIMTFLALLSHLVPGDPVPLLLGARAPQALVLQVRHNVPGQARTRPGLLLFVNALHGNLVDDFASQRR